MTADSAVRPRQETAPASVGEPDTPDADGIVIPPGRRPFVAMVVFLANFMVILDTTIANVSVPHIAGDLGATLAQGSWVITSYAVAEAICVPLTGWLSQRFGLVRSFLVALAGFSLFSLLCGLSVSLPMLVLCRIGQGLCGGPLMPLSQALMPRIFPPAQLPKAYGLWTLTIMVGPAIGPIIGGVLSDQVSWHWIFLINVPIGFLCVTAGMTLLRPIETTPQKLPIDKGGLLLLVIWIGALQLMLDTGREHDWFSSPMIVALATVAGVAFCAFIIWELTERHPAVEIRLFGKWQFSVCVLVSALCYGAFFSGIVIVPQWLQATLGYSATDAGLITCLSTMTAMPASQIVMWLMLRVDTRLLVTIGCLLSAFSFYLRSFWSTDIDFFHLALIFSFQGIGMPFLMMPLTQMAMSTMTVEDTASGAGLNNFLRTMSVAISTALVLSTWNNSAVTARVAMAEQIDPQQAAATLGTAGISGAVIPSYLSALVDRQATTLAMLDTFLLAATAMLVSGAAIWVLPRIEMTRLKGTQARRGAPDLH
jgi:DHA2 family multidrug resistance protein